MAAAHPRAAVAALIDDPAALSDWPDRLAAFIDLDTGMHRTGVPATDAAAVCDLAAAAATHGVPLRGLHVYDGHLSDRPARARQVEVDAGLHQLARLVGTLRAAGHAVGEVNTGSSHTFVETLSADTVLPVEHVTISVGTAVYNDGRSLARYAGQPGLAGLTPAVGVLTRVVSRGADRVTVDAGLTAIQVDAGRPHAEVVGHPELVVGQPAQEHPGAEWRDRRDRSRRTARPPAPAPRYRSRAVRRPLSIWSGRYVRP